ncbi:Uu.00g057250.m01.CDS01 [Anthostomella pinea]|uniref:Uu.00g057250.m01.CDS01 n=1 Tax=Anthostomella pinea TaxID=933095 RepID=A0AAI8VRN1_9PEZI|nr:Uu.00g057250.m01.CDS01 [Anthostomella pinea]
MKLTIFSLVAFASVVVAAMPSTNGCTADMKSILVSSDDDDFVFELDNDNTDFPGNRFLTYTLPAGTPRDSGNTFQIILSDETEFFASVENTDGVEFNAFLIQDNGDRGKPLGNPFTIVKTPVQQQSLPFSISGIIAENITIEYVLTDLQTPTDVFFFGNGNGTDGLLLKVTCP